MHWMALHEAEASSLGKANEVIVRRWRAKKTRLRQGGSLRAGDVQDIMDYRAMKEQIQHEIHENNDQRDRGSNCDKVGYNVCTCQEDIEVSGESDFEQIELISLAIIVQELC